VTYKRREVIGGQTLYLGDCMEVMAGLGKVDAVVTDPPFSERTHKGHDAGAHEGKDKSTRARLGYSALSETAVQELSKTFSGICTGWTVWMTDHTLAPVIQKSLEDCGRYVFAPLPFYQAGRSVRLSGDGPCSWTDWIIVSRTAAQMRWGTLRGGYIAGEGWNDKQRMGGKPLPLMLQVVSDYSRQGQIVLDPFLGGGTTAVACQKLGRHCIGIEIDPEAFERACDRVHKAWQEPDMFIAEPAPKPVQTGLDL
jgi:hypothetical protein